ncbi:Bromodomain containing protein [Trichomonas vaginalis G3]|uniref:Bromodomain containing protein n=1 Tax=Trichomonas vaginalis (strain ATCC PRA-98 / G3) TaxID=412133 RepID=A2E5E3_TRIV3|nr:chromatin organization [Trichomonas vaginalis G3]EAY12104.1 Bromodomain containing protein [Trichomonas vaginalis G3]KAI5542436.1 chromatin organization [Trichomonas vaginalis G3]|eukprot:XP_001324327.1 Bromodomain containing protein [Trichomonas vaginalis G3]
MENSLKLKLLEVIAKIKKRPSAKWFLDPVDTSSEEYSDYLEQIKTPMDLNTLENQLKNGKYNSVNEFREDLSLIWRNCQQYWQEDSITTTLAMDIKQYAENLLNYITDRPDIDWINKLMFLSEQFADAIKPINAANVISNKKRSPSSPCIRQFDKFTQDDEKITEDELIELQKDIQNLDSDDEKLSLLECIRSCQPKLVGQKLSVTLNLSNLQPRTIFTLMDKVNQLKAQQARMFEALDAKK